MRKVGAIAIATYGKQQDVIAYRPPKYSVSVFKPSQKRCRQTIAIALGSN
ncbi:MAG: hypothetical protein HC941_22775 [Microcoleus sp. SU_5_3]|nr:hypothetical protein [Microcoleus sp. SU_5_3]